MPFRPIPSRRDRIEQALKDLSGLQHLYPNYHATLKAMLAEENERKEHEQTDQRRSPRQDRKRSTAS